MKQTLIETFPRSFPIISPSGGILGYVDDVAQEADRITVTGWTIADEVGLCSGTSRDSTVPTLDRPDVRTTHPGLISANRGDRVGFQVKNNIQNTNVYLFLRVRQETHYIHLGK